MAKLRLGGSWADYQRKISEGKAQFHNFGLGFAITEVVEYNHPHERVLTVLLLGGEKFEEWKAEADLKLVSFARVNGCEAIEFACRLGLEKKIKGLGYRRHRVLMRKDLRHEQTLLENSRLRTAA